MKHLVLQIMNNPFSIEELYKGLEPGWVMNNCFTIVQDASDDQTFVEIRKEKGRGYRIGQHPDWVNVLGNMQESFLQAERDCQLDLVIDGSGASRTISTLKEICDTSEQLGITLAIQLIFMADVRSSFYQEEQDLYNTIKQALLNFNNGTTDIHWNCAYLLTTMTEEQSEFRKAVLPFIIRFDSSLFSMEVRAFGGQLRFLDINAIEHVPQDLSVSTMCNLLLRSPKKDALSILLLSKSTAGLSKTEKLQGLQDGLDRLERIQYPSAIDLLVQKGNPLGDTSTNILFPKFCKDNPQSDPSFYKRATMEELARTPVVAKAVLAWEETVVNEACASGEMTSLIEMMYPNSEFDNLLREYQMPDIMNSEIKLTDRDGYTEIAAQKLESFSENLRKILQYAIFNARIKLIRSRVPLVRNRLIAIRNERKKAVEQAEENNKTKDVTELLEFWARNISTELTNATHQIELPAEGDDISKWIKENAKLLLERIPAPDLEEGRKELARSGRTIMEKMKAQTASAFVPAALSGALGSQLQDKWIIYQQIDTPEDHLISIEPIVIRLTEFHMHLVQATGLDQRVFMAPLIRPANTTVSPDTQQEEERKLELEGTPVVIPDFNDEQLDTFTGEIKWHWDSSNYRNARAEVYADTGAPGDMKQPILVQNVKFSSDDRYRIEGKEKLPSGVPLIIRFIYLEQGADANTIRHEMRMKARKTLLDVEIVPITEGALKWKKTYTKLRITPHGAFNPDHIAIGSTTGHIYTADWEKTSDGSWLSERLPSFESWWVVDRPGDLIEYDISQ